MSNCKALYCSWQKGGPAFYKAAIFLLVAIASPLSFEQSERKETTVMSNIKPYKKNAFRTTDANGKYIFAECDEKSASEMNRFDWREENKERTKKTAVKGCDVDGNMMDFDPKAKPRECSWEQLVSLGIEPRYDDEESLEDRVLNKVFTDNRIGILYDIFPTLSDEEHHIIIAEMEGISSREYEKKYKTPRSTYLYRREKLFDRLRSMIEAREQEKRHSSLARM